MKIKKIIASALIVVLALSVSFSVFGAVLSEPVDNVSQNVYDRLGEMGFPQKAIGAMNDLTKEKAASYDGTFDSAIVQYYSKNMNLMNQIEIEAGEKNGNSHSYRVDNPAVAFALFVVNLANGDKALVLDYQWKKMPLNRWVDEMGLQWDSSKWFAVEDSFYKANNYSVAGSKNDRQLKWDRGETMKNTCPAGVIWDANLKVSSLFQRVNSLYGVGSVVIRPYENGGGRAGGGYIHKKFGANKSLDFGEGNFYCKGMSSTYDQLSLFKNI